MRCLRADLHSAPGRLRASACRYYGRRGRCYPGLGQAAAGNARCQSANLRPPVGAAVSDWYSLPRPRKPGLKQNLGDESPLGTEPRWDADRRARDAFARAASGQMVCATSAPTCLRCGGDDIASVGVPLPFFLRSFVARMERSVIRVRHSSLSIVPGLHFVPSGLRARNVFAMTWQNSGADASRERVRAIAGQRLNSQMSALSTMLTRMQVTTGK